MAYIDWWNRTGPITLGERFGLNEISIARNTLSPTKSYTEGGRLKAAGPLLLAPYLLPYAATFIGTAATGLMAQKQIQNYFADNPDAFPKFKEWVSKFIPTIHGGEELEKIEPVGGKIETWGKSYTDTGIKVPEKLPESKGLEIPPVDIKPEGSPIPEQKGWQEYVLQQDQPEKPETKTKLVKKLEQESLRYANMPDIKTKEEVIKETGATRENLGPYIILANITRLKKVPNTKPTYFFQKPGPKGSNTVTRTPESSDLNAVKAERNAYLEELKKQQGDFVDRQTFVDLVRTGGIRIGKEQASDNPINFSKIFNIKYKEVGNKTVYDISSLTDERLKEIKKRRTSTEEKLKIAKQLIEEQGILTQAALTKALHDEGMPAFSHELLVREFPNLRGHAWLDRETQDYYGKKAGQKRRKFLKLYSGKKAEETISRMKRTLGYGPTVNLMHRKQKKKLVGVGALDVSDVLLGSYEENKEYNAQNLEKVRNSFNTTQDDLRKKYTKADLNKKVDVSLTMQKRLKLPKTLILKEYIKKINMGVDELSSKTSGKVDGYLFDVEAWKFTPNPVTHVDILDVPGLGMLKGDLQKYDWIKSKLKLKYPVKKGKKQAPFIDLDESGMPKIKKGAKLTNKEASDLFLIFENLKWQLPRAEKSKPVQIPYARGGRTGFKSAGAVFPYDIIKGITEDPKKTLTLAAPIAAGAAIAEPKKASKIVKEIPKKTWNLGKQILSKALGIGFSPTGLAGLLAWHAKGKDAKEIATSPWTYSYAPFLGVGAEGVEFITKNIKSPAIKSFVQKALSLGVFTPAQIIKASRITTPAGWLAIIGTTLATMPEDKKSVFLKEMKLGPEFEEKLKEEKEEYYTEGEHYVEGGIASLIK